MASDPVAVADSQATIDLNAGDENPTATKPSADDDVAASVVVEGDEPYVGQEFESEESAQAFYAAYGTRMGFMTRMSSISRKSGLIVRRTLVCNKEGFYNDKRTGEKIRKRPRTLTRVGCKAMLVIRRLSTGVWVVKKLVTEHTHPLAERPPKFQFEAASSAAVRDRSPGEDKRVRELTIQLLREKKRSASFRKIIDVLVDHIKEHTEDVSKTVQSVGENINKIESDFKN